MKTCDNAPKGWKCTRNAGHDGPCAAVKDSKWKQLWNGIGTAIGEAMFGGGR